MPKVAIILLICKRCRKKEKCFEGYHIFKSLVNRTIFRYIGTSSFYIYSTKLLANLPILVIVDLFHHGIGGHINEVELFSLYSHKFSFKKIFFVRMADPIKSVEY